MAVGQGRSDQWKNNGDLASLIEEAGFAEPMRTSSLRILQRTWIRQRLLARCEVEDGASDGLACGLRPFIAIARVSDHSRRPSRSVSLRQPWFAVSVAVVLETRPIVRRNGGGGRHFGVGTAGQRVTISGRDWETVIRRERA